MSETSSISQQSGSEQQTMASSRNPAWAVSLQMAYRNVRNRLGRMIVTWLGIVLGIAFLMSAMVTGSIRAQLRDVSAQRAAVESMLGAVRAEVGNLSDKKIVIVAEQTGGKQELLVKFIDRIKEIGGGLELVGPLSVSQAEQDTQVFAGASALVAWLPEDWQGLSSLNSQMSVMKQPVVVVYGDRSVMMARMPAQGRVRELLAAATEQEKNKQAQEEADRKTRTHWLIGISLLVAAIGISNALLMSVTERYREIGTMKCMGALDSFVIRMILLESAFLGGIGALGGIVLGGVFATAGFSGTHGLSVVLNAIDSGYFVRAGVLCYAVGWFVAIVAAVYPARVAAQMVPAAAMRTEI